jgi:DNA-binding transcriptional LysR family regulator
LLPSTSSLRALEALDRLGSATAVSRELNLTQSAVSRQLKSLEEQLGLDLFIREGRSLTLTQEAQTFASDVRTALHKITQASLRLTVNPGGGSLDLAILPTFGMRWLVPRLADFARRYPDVSVNLTTRFGAFNFDAEHHDAAIFFGSGEWPGADSLLLRNESVVAVCAPGLLENRVPKQPSDILGLPLLHIESRPDAWNAWLLAHGVADQRVGGAVYDQFATIIQAALHGIGVALLPDYLTSQDIAAGRLVQVWGGPTPMPGAYYLVWPKEKSRDPALMSFRDWLGTQTDEEDSLPR